MNSTLFFRTSLILLGIFILFALISHYNKSNTLTIPPYEYFAGNDNNNFDPLAGSGTASPPVAATPPSRVGVTGNEPNNMEQYRPVNYIDQNGTISPNDCMPRDKLTAEDLLPKDAVDSKWAQVNPAGQGSVGDQNFLSAGYHVGIDTQMSSLKIANYDLRPSPVIQQRQVSPWNQSTVMPDISIKSLC